MKAHFVIFLISSCLLTAQEWTNVEGTSAFINNVFFNKNTDEIFVSSDNMPADFQHDNINFPNFGVGQNGFRIINKSGSFISDEILKDYSVFDFLSYPGSPNIIFAAIRQFNEGGIIKSVDGGKSWDLSAIKCLTPSQIVRFAASGSTMFFGAETNSSKGLIFSYDTFNLCLTDDMFVINARDIKVSPLDSNLLFIGGNRSLRHFYFSADRGITWNHDLSGLENKRILTITPSAYSIAVVFAGVDSLDYNKISYGKGIYRSLDTGKTWAPLAASGKRVFSISTNPDNPKFLAAACDSGSVLISGSWGYAWEEYSSGLPKNASVRTIAVTSWGGSSSVVALAGTFGQGLYKSSPLVTDINNQFDRPEIISVSPNPFNENINIAFQNKSQSGCKIEIINCLGEIEFIHKIQDSSDLHELSINTADLTSGMYFIRISDGKNMVINKIIKQ